MVTEKQIEAGLIFEHGASWDKDLTEFDEAALRNSMRELLEAVLPDAEPDGWISEDEFTLGKEHADEWKGDGLEPKPFYFAPPAPSDDGVEKAARLVETWWLERGMYIFNGAPYAIFALRSALAKRGPPTPAPDAWQPPNDCDGKEQPAFEAWAIENRYDMHEHPLHYLFMDAKTNAARQGWKAALKYVRDQFSASSIATKTESMAAPDGWKLVPNEPLPAQLETAAFKLSAEYGPEFVLANQAFARDVYSELVTAAPKVLQDVAGTVEAFDREHPELYWHIAKGKITDGEPLYGAIITDLRGNELGDGESNISAIDAFKIAVEDTVLPAGPAAKLEQPR